MSELEEAIKHMHRFVKEWDGDVHVLDHRDLPALSMVLAELERLKAEKEHSVDWQRFQGASRLAKQLADDRKRANERVAELEALTDPCPDHHEPLDDVLPGGHKSLRETFCTACGGVGRVKAQPSLTEQAEHLAVVPFPERLGTQEETSYLGHYRVPDGLAQPIRHDESSRRFVLCWNTLYDEHPYLSWMPLDEVHKHYGAGYEPVLVGSWETKQC